MHCIKCGKEIPDGENKICDECKNSLLTNLESDEDAHKFEIKKEQNPKKEEPPKKKRKLGVIIAIILIIAVITAIVVAEFTTGVFSNIFTKRKVGIEVGNNNNNLGCSNIQGDWIYYMSLAKDGTEIALNKIKTDGTEQQVLVQKDWEIYSINVMGDYLYFIAFEPTEEGTTTEGATSTAYQHNKIYKMSLDGKELKVINDKNFSPESISMYVANNRIYYMGENYNIYSMDLNGGDRKLVSDNGTGFIGVTDKYILYNDYPENPVNETDFVTYIMNIDGTDAKPVNGKRLYNPNIIGDMIYYVNSDNNAIHRINVDGTEDVKIYDSKAYNMNVQGDWIYYLNYKDENEESTDESVCIHKVRTDGTEHTIITEMENYTSFINILGDWIYYTDHSDNVYYINIVKTDGSEIRNLYKYDFNGESTTSTSSNENVNTTIDTNTATNTATSNTANSTTNTAKTNVVNNTTNVVKNNVTNTTKDTTGNTNATNSNTTNTSNANTTKKN